eukprot:TRINITY_DN10802_c0_g1_i1.p1 TRINITY_DN10802_c0_g1~~TRINITY_DN10802_c0_g1_i1.p1  ORF type:complete len:724 (-),score=71.19 TRINITY_DN10802_c0_g1_i1:79-2250(-)
MYEQSEISDKYTLTGRAGRPIDEFSPLSRLKERGREHYIENNIKERPELDIYDVRIMIVITMYNESIDEFKKTMKGLMISIKELHNKFNVHPEEIGIFLVADGIAAIKKDFLAEMTNIGLYSEEMMPKDKYFVEEYGRKKDLVQHIRWDDEEIKLHPENNVCHLFQTADCMSKLGIDIEGEVTPYNFFFAIKHFNGGKLDSHFWFFKGFAEYLCPKYCFLVDIGTAPQPGSLSTLFAHMEAIPTCGGICGEIEVELSPDLSICTLGYWLILAQFVEYKMSYFLDKAFESFFGFISVLPGAFSGYRWVSISGEPLTQYFKGLNKNNLGAFEGNMYLAEDRIMCLSIINNPLRRDTLTYIPGARAITDAPKTLSILMKQRRRWINGSNFASFFVLSHFPKIWGAQHSIIRKLVLSFLFIYHIFLSILTFLSVGCGYAAFSVFTRYRFPPENWYDLTSVLENIYLITLFLILIWSLCKDINASSLFFGITSIIMGLLLSYMIYATLVYLLWDIGEEKDKNLTNITFWLVVGLIACFVLPVIFNISRIGRYCAFFVGIFMYLFFSPLYMNIFVIFAFCNTHDLSWGNRPPSVKSHEAGVRSQEENKKFNRQRKMENKSFRTHFLVLWIICNVAIGYAITKIARAGKDNYILIFTAYILFVISFKLLFSLIYSIQDWCWCLSCSGMPSFIRGITYLGSPAKPKPMTNVLQVMMDHLPAIEPQEDQWSP